MEPDWVDVVRDEDGVSMTEEQSDTEEIQGRLHNTELVLKQMNEKLLRLSDMLKIMWAHGEERNTTNADRFAGEAEEFVCWWREKLRASARRELRLYRRGCKGQIQYKGTDSILYTMHARMGFKWMISCERKTRFKDYVDRVIAFLIERIRFKSGIPRDLHSQWVRIIRRGWKGKPSRMNYWEETLRDVKNRLGQDYWYILYGAATENYIGNQVMEYAILFATTKGNMPFDIILADSDYPRIRDIHRATRRVVIVYNLGSWYEILAIGDTSVRVYEVEAADPMESDLVRMTQMIVRLKGNGLDEDITAWEYPVQSTEYVAGAYQMLEALAQDWDNPLKELRRRIAQKDTRKEVCDAAMRGLAHKSKIEMLPFERKGFRGATAISIPVVVPPAYRPWVDTELFTWSDRQLDASLTWANEVFQ